MNRDTLQLALVLAAGAAAVWAATKGFRAVQEGAAVITEPLAEGYVALTSPPSVYSQIIPRIELPNGTRINPGDVRIANDFSFVWLGVKYQLLQGRNVDGNYDAVLFGT